MPHCCCLVHFDDEIHKLWWGLALSDLMFHRFWILHLICYFGIGLSLIFSRYVIVMSLYTTIIQMAVSYTCLMQTFPNFWSTRFHLGFPWGSWYSMFSFVLKEYCISKEEEKDRCLSFWSFGHCVVCPSSIYGFWLPLWYLQIRLALVSMTTRLNMVMVL